MPARSVTSISISPLRASSGTPLTSILTVSSLMFRYASRRDAQVLDDAAPAVLDHVLELVPEVLQEALHRPGGRVPERADRVALDLVRDVHEHVQIRPRALAFDDSGQHAPEPAGAFAARRALAARLRHVEARD